jgi:ubiquinol-cytochrome c reductase cytochrome b subunit
VILPTIFVTLLYSVPFLDRRIARRGDGDDDEGDDVDHNLLDRPRDRPVRTAVGVGVLTLLGLLLLAGSQDLLAEWTDTPIAHVTAILRVVVLVAPPLVGLLTWQLCHELVAAEERRPWPPATPGGGGPRTEPTAPGGADERTPEVAVATADAGADPAG